MDDNKKKLTDAEKAAIAAKYKRRIIELGTPLFGSAERWFVLGPDDPTAD